jgi:hypothetical protein
MPSTPPPHHNPPFPTHPTAIRRPPPGTGGTKRPVTGHDELVSVSTHEHPRQTSATDEALNHHHPENRDSRQHRRSLERR